MDTIKLSIVSPSGEIFCDDVKTVVLPGKEGEFGVLPNHSSLVSALTVGVIDITYTDSSKDDLIAINWGHVKVSENKVDVLVDGAVLVSDNENSTIAHNIEKAKELINSVKDSNVSLASVEARITSFA